MAQRSMAEETRTDFSGLASSLLPPSGPFFSGWTGQQWQEFSASCNTRDMPGGQRPSTKFCRNDSVANGAPYSATASQLYDATEHRASGGALGFREASVPISAALANSAKAHQDSNGKGYETNMAISQGANETYSTSAALLENSTPSPNTVLSSTPAPAGALAELKLKAKESILAKRAQNVRSPSQETAVQMNGTELNRPINGDVRTRIDTPKTSGGKAQHERSLSEERSVEAIQAKLDLSTAASSRNLSKEVSEGHSPHVKVDSNLLLSKADRSQGVIASSAELEDLLAEGKAAAERRSLIAPESAKSRNGPEHRTQAVLADQSKPPAQTNTGMTVKSCLNERISAGSSPQQRQTTTTARNGTDWMDESRLHDSEPRQIPAKYTTESSLPGIHPHPGQLEAKRDMDMSPVPKQGDHRRQTYRPQTSEPPAHGEPVIGQEKNGASRQSNVNDIEEWLTMTGFYDELYRQKVLNRRRRMKAIEKERLQLLLEEQADQEQRSQLVRSHSVLATNAASVSPFPARASPVLPVPKPPVDLSATKDVGIQIKDSTPQNQPPRGAANPPEDVMKTGSVKRPNSPSEMKKDEGHARKMMRTGSHDHDEASSRLLRERASAGSPLIQQQNPPAYVERFVKDKPAADTRRDGDQDANYSTKRRHAQWVSDKPTVLDHRRRDSYENHDALNFDSDRRNGRPAVNSGPRYSTHQNLDSRRTRYAEHDRYQRASEDDSRIIKPGINLRVANVRYFLIKSWNYENIETAQQECTWCTQTKNEDLFVDAFRNSTHVILIFSANNSHAFQGYAKMQSLPGEPGVVDPSWRKRLHWPTTKPFKVKWITKGNSSYRVAGDLRNPLNEDSMVFVGRDGQEIPDYIGLQLCKALDQDARYRSDKLDY